MQSETRGGLFPSDPHEFESLVRKALSGPRTPFVRPDPKEEAAYDAKVKEALREKVARLEFETTKVELAKIVSSICYQELIEETNRDFGTESTRSTYKSDFGNFKAWCADQQLPSLPTSPEILAIYLITRASEGGKPDRLARMVSSVRYIHAWSNLAIDADDVIVRATMR
jgi:hypothetical protein